MKALPLAIAAIFSAPGMAAIQGQVCHVNDIVNACNANNNLVNDGILVIRGYAYDKETGDSPQKGGYLILSNLDTAERFKVPINATEARPDLIADFISIDDDLNRPQNYQMAEAGFVARIFTASLPVGRYAVTEARVSMRKAGVVPLTLNAEKKAQITISPESVDGVFVVDPEGKSHPLKMVRDYSGRISLTGYPVLRDGNYQIVEKISKIESEAQSVNVQYRRPVVHKDYSVPLALDFPGVEHKISLTNPLNNKQMSDTVELELVSVTGSQDFSLNGKKYAQGGKMAMTPKDRYSIHTLRIADDGDEPQESELNFFINLPDAPNVRITTRSWHPADQILTSVSKPTAAVKVEDISIESRLREGAANLCQMLYTIRDTASIQAITGLTCSIQWNQMSTGMKYGLLRSNSISGALQNVGENVFTFTPGVIYRDPANNMARFFSGKKDVVSTMITGVEPPLIAMSFDQDRSLHAPQDLISAAFEDDLTAAYADPANRRSAGVVIADAPYKRMYTKITYPDGEEKLSYGTSTSLRSYVMPLIKDAWGTAEVKVESWYDLAPEYKSEMMLSFVGYPKNAVIMIDRDQISHTQADTELTGKLGLPVQSQVNYDTDIIGSWQVVAIDRTSGKALGQPASINSDGSFSLNLGRLDAGNHQLELQGQMLNREGDVVNPTAVTKMHNMVTQLGEVLVAELQTREDSGRVPFNQTINVKLNEYELQRSIGPVNWEMLNPDGEWVRLQEANGNDVNRTSLYVQHKEVGEYTYRAVLTNKYSGETYTTGTKTLQAYQMPDIVVVGPNAVNQNSKATFTIHNKNEVESDYSWKVVSGGAYSDVEGEDTGEFSFVPKTISNYLIEVTAREKGAPETSQSQVVKRVAFRAVDPLIARATITGPRYVEIGKEYTFNAKINDIVSASQVKNYELKGFWSLPNGERIDGDTVNYVIGDGDKHISYMTYIDGSPEKTSIATYSFSSWKYKWPENWEIALTPIYTDVPARIRYRIQPTQGGRIQDLNGEALEIEWSLPNGVSREENDKYGGFFNINEHGMFMISAQVKDTRGNVVNVTSNQFSILPTAEVETEARITSKYGESYYAPGTYYVGLRVNRVPRGDSFMKNEMIVNGEKVSEFYGSGAYVNFTSPGMYDVTVRTITKHGNMNEDSLMVDVQDAPAPECSITDQAMSIGRYYMPTCTVSIGFVKSYLWTYVLDGEEKRSTSKSFQAQKAWILNDRISSLKLTVESDMSKKSEFDVTLKPMD